MASVEQNKQIVWNYLKGKGLTDEQASGIMGNIQQESGFDTSATNSSSGAYGLFQWLGGRKTNLQSYAKSQGKSASDINVQLDFFWKELNSSEKNTLKAFQSNSSGSVDYWTETFEKKFERGGGVGLDKKKNYASKIYSQFNGTGVTGVTQTATSSSSNDLKWWGDLVVILFCIIVVIGGVVFLAMAVTKSTGIDTKKIAKKAVKK